ncbi:MAG: hypothetical protein GEV11_24375 [Streptosporangiales bacterium]|nr:hypothetical protein [Streptosporangiales bacterium]
MTGTVLEFAITTPDSLAVRPLVPQDGPLLERLFERLTDERELGGARGPADAVSAYIALPEGKGYEDKVLLGVWRGDVLIGAIDCIRDHPRTGTWTFGMFALDPRYRLGGRGLAVLRGFERAAAARGAVEMRAGIRPENVGGTRFAEMAGYRGEGRSRADPDLVVYRHELDR